MFGTIRKHQTWLWAVIITLTIISFVVFFSPYSRMNNTARASGNFGSINGERISMDNYQRAKEEVYLEYFFMSGGNWLSNESEAKKMGFDVEQRLYGRLLLIQKLKQFGVDVSPDVAAQFANEMLHPLAQRANLPSAQAFFTQALKPRGLQMEDFDRFVRHELGIQELIATVGMSGKLVTPQETQALYVREHQELATEAIFFSASNYLDRVAFTPDAVARYYTNQMANYRLPERVQVSFVKFPYTNYQAQAEKEVTNLNEIVEANYRNPALTNYTPEEAKVKVRQEVLLRQEVPLARKDAATFANSLFAMTPANPTNPPNPANLAALAETNNLSVTITPPFDREEGPREVKVGPEFVRAAFGLSAEEPFSEPILTREAVYVIALLKQLPSEIPAFETIRDKVTADYRLTQATDLARKAGMDFAQTLTKAMGEGKTFTAAAEEAKLKAVQLPPFSLSSQEVPATEDHISLSGRGGLKEIAFSTTPGKVSGFRATSEGGIILYVKSQLPIDEAKMKADLPAFATYVRQSRQREAFEAWFRKEADRGLRDTPIFQPVQPKPSMSSAAKS